MTRRRDVSRLRTDFFRVARYLDDIESTAKAGDQPGSPRSRRAADPWTNRGLRGVLRSLRP